MFYWILLNIPPYFRSRLSSINLFAMVKKKILDKYSFNDVLQPFFEEIRQLWTGVYFLIGEKRTKCCGKVLLCLGDTEGQHQIGGFKVSVGWALRKCRMCYVTVDVVCNNFDPKSFVPRCKDSYTRNCDDIDNATNPGVKGELQTTFSIINISCLLDIPNFDVSARFECFYK